MNINEKKLNKAIKTAYICYIEDNELKIYTYDQVNINKPYFSHIVNDIELDILKKDYNVCELFFTFNSSMFMNKTNYFIVKDSLNKIKDYILNNKFTEECDILI